MSAAPFRILILCTGNSARSQMAEAIFRALGGNRVDVASAGTRPQPTIHPFAEEAVERLGISMGGQFPKTVDHFVDQAFDFIITVCDDAAEQCPLFQGDGQRLHWSYPDPAAATGSDEERQDAFDAVADDLRERVRGWLHAHSADGSVG